MPTTEMKKFLETIDWIKDNIQLVRNDATHFGKTFGTRSPGEVLRSKQTNYLNTCLDLTMATIHLLKEKGFKPVLVAQEGIYNTTKKPVVHFMIEVEIDRELYSVDYKRGKIVDIYKGPVRKESAARKHIAFQRFDTTKLEKNMIPFEFFGVRDMSEIHKVLPNCTKEGILALTTMMEKANKTRLFNRVKNTNKRINRR